MKNPQDTSWQRVAPWYHKLVGNDGHYYHDHVVMPGVKRLLQTTEQSRLLDLGCGQGILAKKLPNLQRYVGIDKAEALITAAKHSTIQSNYAFMVRDVTRPLSTIKEKFSHAAIILALQNMEQPAATIKNAANLLEPGGSLVIVLNHPCFRIPRQSGWGVDEKTKQQYRWINRYRTALKIPIVMNPGQARSTTTWSFHHSLSDYSQMLTDQGFVITALEEWTSDKESVGKAAKMENRARSEFPLFLAIKAELRK